MGSGKPGLSNTFLTNIMKHITLHGTAREKGRKSSIKSIRREGQVPCVLYGNGIENVLFSVDARELKALTHTPNSYIVDLDIDGKSYLAVMHELQFQDFLAISADKPVSIDVPLNIFGNCAGVKAGGKLLIEARKLRVSGLPDQIPDVLDIDITNLKLGKQIVAGDLSFEGIQMSAQLSTPVPPWLPPRIQRLPPRLHPLSNIPSHDISHSRIGKHRVRIRRYPPQYGIFGIGHLGSGVQYSFYDSPLRGYGGDPAQRTHICPAEALHVHEPERQGSGVLAG